jgi:hypothetical protein
VRFKLGIKAWSTLSAMLLSLVVISGCNEESTTPSASPGPGPVTKAPEGPKKGAEPAPPPTSPKAEEKK